MDKKTLINAENELKDFLERHTHLAELQEEIEKLKQSCGDDPLQSTVMIFEVMKQCLLQDLIPALGDLDAEVNKLKETFEK
ncbi:MAG: hypothetical protein HN576_09340 [Bacteriovoracaceae bacterium]|jgi:hypothetical protein|nr:hypothetical protein [Bacteriovoracaceae bacterium]